MRITSRDIKDKAKTVKIVYLMLSEILEGMH